ncbi:SDR family NAD(P)-dependent oxidoreductase [Malacoplasma penetrans]|uniref:SDR family NAD(P)-dependent oxidoreductase n=1 Tax=Malacoplasma penetrans TaxID=28227 RepID=UPI002D1E3ABB|nr:SDR family NAD(P)-dependent oxidoreductase [Malacoplasma penetrans]
MDVSCVHASSDTKLADIVRKDFDCIVNINLGGIYNCIKYEIAQMLKQSNKGVIVNCFSQSGVVGLVGVSVYTKSKHAVFRLTKCSVLKY